MAVSDNIVNADFSALYNDADALDFSAGSGAGGLAAGAPLPGVAEDYCGTTRSNAPSRGAIEMPAACDVAGRLPRGGVFETDAAAPNPPADLMTE